MTECINEIKKNFTLNLDDCNNKFESCNDKCINSNCSNKCEKLYNCKNEQSIINDIENLEDIIKNLNENNFKLIYLTTIGKIINNNFTENDKKYIREKFTNKLNCKDINNPCIINSKYLLHLILELLKKKYSIISLYYHKINMCHNTIGLPIDSETYKLKK